VLIMPSYRQAGTVLAGHTFSVPLDHDRPEGERIEIFARETAAGSKARVTGEYEHDGLRTSNGAVLDRLLTLARGTG
jgi:hypothetical protein